MGGGLVGIFMTSGHPLGGGEIAAHLIKSRHLGLKVRFLVEIL